MMAFGDKDLPGLLPRRHAPGDPTRAGSEILPQLFEHLLAAHVGFDDQANVPGVRPSHLGIGYHQTIIPGRVAGSCA